MAVGAYPGSFNPLTVAHLAVAEAAHEQCGLERVDLVISEGALGKDDIDLVAIEDRVAVLDAAAATRPWLAVRVTRDRLIADIAAGYDVIILGADKWAQVVDPAWYSGSSAARDAVVDRLPVVACAPRPPAPMPAGAIVLDVHPDHHGVSATEVRGGRTEWMAPEAVAFDRETGAWSDPARAARTRRPTDPT
jgi:hypothetical protein